MLWQLWRDEMRSERFDVQSSGSCGKDRCDGLSEVQIGDASADEASDVMAR